MKLAHKHTTLMHCLPANLDFEITTAVMDRPQSTVFDLAENQLHAPMPIMALGMGQQGTQYLSQKED